MRPTFRILNNRAKTVLRGTTLLAGIGAAFVATAPAYAADAQPIETVVVTGYRASLAASTDAKRASTNFTDSIFAEDIGKFPDSNIAESLNRIPGVTISREIDGEGVNVSIRGLGTNFAKILLNGAQVAVASTGGTDSSNTNREVDLNMFPTELFTQLTVSKSATPDTVEGGAAGTINMRSARPFDYDGAHFTYTAQGTDNSNADGLGERGAMLLSDTWGSFGALIGVAGVHNNIFIKGWEDGNSGWTNPNIQTGSAQCGAGNTCDGTNSVSIGGNNFSIPTTVPNNVGNGLVAGTPIDAAFLLAHNPGLSIAQISNALIPRLGRSMYESGTRDRYNGVVALEWRPMDSLHFYLDAIGGRSFNAFDRSDIDWVGRNGAVIPLNEKVDANNVVTQGTFANSQFFLEARPYRERTDFLSFNPGVTWEIADDMHFDLQANWSKSNFFRDSPTILVITPLSAGNAPGVPGPTPPVGGVTVTFDNTGGVGLPPTISTNLDLNNPANFQWAGGRVNIQQERRTTSTKGVHGDLSWGGDTFTLKGGVAFDDVYRNIRGLDNSQAWQNAVCGDNPSQFLPGPNTQPGCNGLNVVANGPTTAGNAGIVNAVSPGAVPTYPGYGTGYTTGFPALTYAGSLIPQSALATYLTPGPTGFITVNYPAFKTASHYDQFATNVPFSTGSNTGASSGIYEEKTYGFYLQGSGVFNIDQHNLRYNAGLRWITTNQLISGPSVIVNPGNGALADGGKYPNTNPFGTTKHNYQAFLPSVNLVYEVSDDFQVRASVSRTMTRPNPNTMLPGLNFSDQAAATASLGNPALKPFFSNNIDIGGEFYTGNEGYFGVAVFRKALSGFTISGTTQVPFAALAVYGVDFNTLSPTQQNGINSRGGPGVATVNITQQVNAGGLLTINGMEFNWVQPLDFVTKDWFGVEGFGFTANLTIIDQKSSGAAPAIAQGVSPLQYNLTGYYEHDGVMVRLAYVYNDKVYASGSNQQGVCLPNTAASNCPAGAYLFGAERGQLDMSSSLRLSKLFGDLPSDPELTFDAQNITGTPLWSYFQYPNAIHSYYDQGQVFMFGIRGTF